MTLAFDSEGFDESSFDRGTFFVQADSMIEWNLVSFIEDLLSFEWDEVSFVPDVLQFPWDEVSYITPSSDIKWNNTSYIQDDLDIKWTLYNYVQASSDIVWNSRIWGPENSLIFNWINISGIAWPLTDYLSVKTIQGEYLFPEIIDGEISFKEGSIAEATLEIKSFVPEDAQCTFYLKGDARIFDGISRRCVETEKGTFKLTIQEYVEILKPESDKGGTYLAKNTWHDVQLQYLLSSAKPTDNNNTLGLLYIAKSAILWQFWEVHDATNHIFKFEYSGIPYTITEVFEDETLLTARANAAALETASGWYHDSTNKILYIRCTDDVYPYYHVISVPDIWDFEVPIRIGNIPSSSASTVIAYWETANGDVPLTNIKNLLTALELEVETSIRGGACYVNVYEKIGSGTSAAPARRYIEGENILRLNEIDRADARSMVSGAAAIGYGQGAGAVKAGAHINMGRGGRFILLDDSSLHSTAMAQGFVDKYLEDHYLPAKRIKFVAPVEIGDAIDQRRLGDYVHISLPSRRVEQDLRIQEILLKLKPLSMNLTIGDKLISLEQQWKAMRDAAEKFRKHLADEIEEFDWSWSENLIDDANRTNKFTVTDDALKIQKLELSVSTSLFRDDAAGGAGGGGGYGAGDGTWEEEGEEVSPETGEAGGHTHTLDSGTVGTPSDTVAVAAEGHTHSFSQAVPPEPVATSGPNADGKTSVVASVIIAAINTNTACCTGVNCGKRFVTGVTGGTLTPTPIDVASTSHTHTISGNTGGNDSSQTVASYDHTHDLDSLSMSTELDHTHPISSTGYNPTLATAQNEIAVDPATGDPFGDWMETGFIFGTGGVPVTHFKAPGSNPNMYFSVLISGPGITGEQHITGSPFVIMADDSIGPVLIDNLVTQAGEYTVKVGLSNKDTPGDHARIRFSMQVSGQIFVDTIVKS